MKKKIIALILCICLISCTCIQPAYAMGAEGIIVGGGAAAAGVTLTMPQVALLVAAGFGLVYATQHAEEIYQGLDTALTNAANNIDGGIDQLVTWTEQAAKGSIAIASAPTWIVSAIKSWISGLYETAEFTGPTPVMELPAGTPVVGSDFWNTSAKTYTFDQDVTILRAGRILATTSNNIDYYTVSSYLVAVSPRSFTGANSCYVKPNNFGTKWYYKTVNSNATMKSNEVAGNNKIMYDAVLTLPNFDDIKSMSSDSLAYHYQYMIQAWENGRYPGTNTSDSICPDQTVGGIEGALDVGGIDNINVPDLDIGGSGLLAPDNVGTGSIDDVLNDILTRLKQQELSWSDYMSDVAVGTPSITIEGKEYAIDDTGVTDIPVEDVLPDNPPADGVVVPEGLEPFTMSLTDFFPFCIPFDIADFVNVLCAEPEAPCFNWTFTWYGGDTDTLTIDLSPFDQVAQLLRNMELLLFCIGLALITRNQIRG